MQFIVDSGDSIDHALHTTIFTEAFAAVSKAFKRDFLVFVKSFKLEQIEKI